MFFTSLLNSLPGGFAQGILWGILGLGVYISFRVLDFADLTVEGSIALGGAVTAKLISVGVHPLLATLCALCCGLLAGLITGFLSTKLKIPPILSGILTMLMLYTINLRIMGKANLGLGLSPTIVKGVMSLFGISNDYSSLIIGALFAALTIAGLYWFFGTGIGSAIRATGNNAKMARAQGIDTDAAKILGLVLSNGLIALSGSLITQSQAYADVTMGTGAIVIGLASIILGEMIFKRFKSFYMRLFAVILGSIIYRMIVIIALLAGMQSYDMKLVSALIVIIALSVPQIKNKLKGRNKYAGNQESN